MSDQTGSRRHVRLPRASLPAVLACLTLGGGGATAAAQQAATGAVAGEPRDGLQGTPPAQPPVQGVSLPQVVVVGKRDQAETNFKADRSETATRGGIALVDVPASVTVVTSKVLETQQATSVDDALHNVSSVVLRESAQGLAGFQVRGFSQTSALLNGTTSPFAAQFDVYGIERVEVLKGPQTILSGAESLGGAVNVVSKKPQAEPVRDVVLQVGSRARRTVAADVAGAVSPGSPLSYRVIGSWSQAGNNEAGFDGLMHRALMPQLRWKDARTDVVVGASVDRQHVSPGRYTFALAGIQPAPAMRLGNESDGFDLRSKRLFYSLEQTLAPWATLVSRMQRSLDILDKHLYAAQFPTSTTSFGMVPTNDVTDSRTLSGDHYLRFAFGTGPLGHRLSVGWNHTRQALSRRYYAGALQMVDAYAGAPYPFPPLTHDTLIATDDLSSTQRALFAQDLIELGDFNVLLAVRDNRYEAGAFTNTTIGATVRTTTQPARVMRRTTPSTGVVYKLRPEVSLYAAYTQGFLPQFTSSRNCNGDPGFSPMETKNKELGMKWEPAERRLAVTASMFQLDQSNRLEFVASGSCFRERDAARVRGVEIDVQGEPVTGWRLIFNVAHTRLTDQEKPDAVNAAQPKNAMSLWTTYDLRAPLEGWGLGAGLSAHSRTLSSFVPTATPIPGSAVVDVSLFRTEGRWSVTMGVKNLFDRRLYGYATTPLYVPIEPGRTVMFTLRTSLR